MNSQSTFSSSTSSSSWVHIEPSPSEFDGDLSLEVMSFSSSSIDSLDEPLSPLFSSSASELDSLESESAEEEEIDNLKNSSSVKLLAGGGLFPPPISCLNLFKRGRPCTYLSFCEEDGSFALEEIRIPRRDMFIASREGGRLKLFFHQEDQEEDDEEEEEEAGEDQEEEEAEKGEEEEEKGGELIK